MKRLLWLILICFLVHRTGYSQQLDYLLRSPRGLLMGDAYQQLAEDDYTLFYNPALLGRHKGLSVSVLPIQITAVNAAGETDRFEDFPKSDPLLIQQRLLGFPVHLGGNSVPGFKMGSFGVNLIATTELNFSLENATTPIFDINYNYDRGIALGYAYTLSPKRKRNMKKKDYESSSFGHGLSTSFGVGTKYLQREGLRRNFKLLGTTLLNEIMANQDKDYWSIRKNLGFSKGRGWGYDLGFDQTYGHGHGRVSWGVSLQNVFDTDFERFEGDRDLPVIRQKWGLGTAIEQDYGFFGFTISADLRPLDWDIPFMRKVHLGLKIDLPLVDIFAGINEGYASYGVEVNFFMFKIVAGLYGIEMGSKLKEKESRRGVLYLNLLDFSFDG